jgi:hypothetical protein
MLPDSFLQTGAETGIITFEGIKHVLEKDFTVELHGYKFES